MGKPNLVKIAKILHANPNWFYEEKIRGKLVNFNELSDEEFNEFMRWMDAQGYEIVEYVDKESLLLDCVCINKKHQEAIEKLRDRVAAFNYLRKRFHNPKASIAKVADECTTILTAIGKEASNPFEPKQNLEW